MRIKYLVRVANAAVHVAVKGMHAATMAIIAVAVTQHQLAVKCIIYRLYTSHDKTPEIPRVFYLLI